MFGFDLYLFPHVLDPLLLLRGHLGDGCGIPVHLVRVNSHDCLLARLLTHLDVLSADQLVLLLCIRALIIIFIKDILGGEALLIVSYFSVKRCHSSARCTFLCLDKAIE